MKETITITNHRPYLTLKNHILTIHPFNIKYVVDTEKGIFQYIPNEEEALSGPSCEDLRAEFEPQYDGGAPF